MNTATLIFTWLMAATPVVPEQGHSFAIAPAASVFAAALETSDETIIRGQSPTYPPAGAPMGQPVPSYGQPMPAYGQPMMGAPGAAPFSNDPWLQQNPYGGSPVYPSPQSAPMYSYGANGPAPVQYGMQERIDFTYMPSEGTSGVGTMGIFAIDLEKEFAHQLGGGWSFGALPHIGIRSWDGPTNGGNSSLPGSAYSFGVGMKLHSPEVNRWSVEFGFDPTIATDFKSGLESEAFLFDGYGVAFWRASPQFMVALGVAYWDRVDNIILPYAGVVYTPNDLWEFRLLFPKPRVSYFLGTPNGVATWAYVGAEYHVEAYQVDAFPGARVDRVQIQDWRVVGGLRFEAGWLTSYIEAGWVFDRNVDFEKVGTDFSINNGFITRVGLRF